MAVSLLVGVGRVDADIGAVLQADALKLEAQKLQSSLAGEEYFAYRQRAERFRKAVDVVESETDQFIAKMENNASSATATMTSAASTPRTRAGGGTR